MFASDASEPVCVWRTFSGSPRMSMSVASAGPCLLGNAGLRPATGEDAPPDSGGVT
jgi:hypothetical protein